VDQSRFILKTAIVFTFIGIVIVCASAWWLFDSWSHSPTPTEVVRQETQKVLQAAEYHPGDLTVTFSYEDRVSSLNACSGFLPKLMKRNNNRYSMTIVGVWGDYASPIPGGTGAIVAIVQVDFPDRTLVEMQYYQYALDTCQETETF